MAGWTTPLRLLRAELTQRADEGCVVPGAVRQAIDELRDPSENWRSERIDELYDALMALPQDEDLAAREPDELAAIRALRPSRRVDDLAWSPGDGELRDRLHGAWLGRCTGCALGKPVEGACMRVVDGALAGRRDLKRYLTAKGAWPLVDYVPESTDEADIMRPRGEHCREHIAFMGADDDIHYTLVGLGVLEQKGPDFAWHDVAYYWSERIPFAYICTAETQAVLNFWNRSVRWPGDPSINLGTTPAWTRMHRNPYREWIGAQIRSDGWAYACAGKPELAAEFAWRDACWTHTRNGIYGEMFWAAVQAAAFVESDPARLIAIGLGQIPAACRLALAVRECLGWVESCADFETCMQRVEERWPTMNPVHTINNALICVLALFYGKMDTRDTQAIAVMCALDTDCNGATVGSIVGAASGAHAFRPDLAEALHDRVRPNIIGFTDTTMAELAGRHLKVWKRVDEYQRNRTARRQVRSDGVAG